MKKLILSILLIVSITMVGYSQLKGIDLNEARIASGEEQMEDIYGDLILYEGMPAIFYKLTPVGLKTSHEKILEILRDNDLKFNNPDIERSYLASYIDGYYDYGSLSTSIKVEGSVIEKVWSVDNQIIGWVCNSKFCIIMFPKKDPSQ